MLELNARHSYLAEEREHQSIELFAGAGGLALGLEMAGFTARAMIEIDPYCCQTLRTNADKYFPRATILESDIRTLEPVDVLGKSGLKIGSVEMISGGPPCQGFSIAKESKGGRIPDDPKDALVFDFIRFVTAIRPRVFLMENVPGLLNKMGGTIFERIIESFRQIGYAVNYSVLNSAEYGVPQIRKRLFVLGCRDERLLQFPEPTHGPAQSQRYATIREAFSVLNPSMANQESPRHTKKKVEKLKSVIPGSPWSSWRFRDKFHEPSRCITGHCRDDWIHPLEPRSGTVRELATLQTYPADYVFCGPIMALNNSKFHFQYRQVGNSVPVLLAKAIGRRVLEQIA